MTFFELVKIVLGQSYAEYLEYDGTDLDQRIAKEIRSLSRRYTRLGEQCGVKIDYKDPITQIAYLYMYVASHSDYMVQILQELAEAKGTIFRNPTIHVACLGGGPGSDFLAILKFLEEREVETVEKMICRSYDKEEAWKQTRGKLLTSIDTEIELSRHRHKWDFTDEDSWSDKFSTIDLFTMSYFVSEVYSIDQLEHASASFQRLFREAKPGALFLYNDNAFEELDAYFDEHWMRAGLECVIRGERDIAPRSSEEKAVLLDVYFDKFGKIYPKLKSKVSYRVLRKPCRPS